MKREPCVFTPLRDQRKMETKKGGEQKKTQTAQQQALHVSDRFKSDLEDHGNSKVETSKINTQKNPKEVESFTKIRQFSFLIACKHLKTRFKKQTHSPPLLLMIDCSSGNDV